MYIISAFLHSCHRRYNTIYVCCENNITRPIVCVASLCLTDILHEFSRLFLMYTLYTFIQMQNVLLVVIVIAQSQHVGFMCEFRGVRTPLVPLQLYPYIGTHFSVPKIMGEIKLIHYYHYTIHYYHYTFLCMKQYTHVFFFCLNDVNYDAEIESGLI